ncbi:MAG: pectate lyase [Gillisia sp.]|nr:pectate lyase [Gillisia sp.]
MRQNQILKFIFLFALCVFSGLSFLQAQQLAFPSAEGYGQYATGGRGGGVYKVTNLKDDGEGSFRKGIVRHGARIIVFDVSGTIHLKSSLDINRGDLTIAGQTAPGEGISVAGYPVTLKSDNIIIRYLRFRMGDLSSVEGDALSGRFNKNIIIDHCSISWATDENTSFYANKNFTMQWCIISEALNKSVHHKGAHGYGGIWGGVNASFHHNLISSNNSRNPRFSGSETTSNSENEFVDFRNNVIYNWGDNSIYGGEHGTYNMVNNYFKPGPATSSSKLDRIVEPYKPYGKFYVDGNIMIGSEKITADNWDGGVQCEHLEETRLMTPISIDNNVQTQDALIAYNLVLHKAGSSLQRDAVDKRVVQDVKEGKAHFKNGIIDSQNDVGGWPELKSEKALLDTDSDGMPDSWEIENGLNPNKSDASNFDLSDEYTNIEVYTNYLVNIKSVTTLIDNQKYHFVVAKDGTGDFEFYQQICQSQGL